MEPWGRVAPIGMRSRGPRVRRMMLKMEMKEAGKTEKMPPQRGFRILANSTAVPITIPPAQARKSISFQFDDWLLSAEGVSWL